MRIALIHFGGRMSGKLLAKLLRHAGIGHRGIEAVVQRMEAETG